MNTENLNDGGEKMISANTGVKLGLVVTLFAMLMATSFKIGSNINRIDRNEQTIEHMGNIIEQVALLQREVVALVRINQDRITRLEKRSDNLDSSK